MLQSMRSQSQTRLSDWTTATKSWSYPETKALESRRWNSKLKSNMFFLILVGVRVLVDQSCPTLRNTMDCSLPSSSVRGILQPRILEWIAIPFSGGSSQPRDQIQVSHIAGGFFTIFILVRTIEWSDVW